ncbi:hypothetical protein KUTeg_000572 [Tegillarca granosa]|uniref:Uncharacterized protein n=1 Tax=Tegillarca granosa TaxID=220873 RepID=A0ABQ9FXX6_TEGGR|nr:hypothetical protein KUTeg_000572 [Tegillarca granosa]
MFNYVHFCNKPIFIKKNLLLKKFITEDIVYMYFFQLLMKIRNFGFNIAQQKSQNDVTKQINK